MKSRAAANEYELRVRESDKHNRRAAVWVGVDFVLAGVTTGVTLIASEPAKILLLSWKFASIGVLALVVYEAYKRLVQLPEQFRLIPKGEGVGVRAGIQTAMGVGLIAAVTFGLLSPWAEAATVWLNEISASAAPHALLHVAQFFVVSTSILWYRQQRHARLKQFLGRDIGVQADTRTFSQYLRAPTTPLTRSSS